VSEAKQCQAETYVPVKDGVGESVKCEARGAHVHVDGLLLGSEVYLCKKHREYFERAGYHVTFARAEK